MSPKQHSKRESKAKLARLDLSTASALEATAKLTGISENAILNYAVNNTLASIHPEVSTANLRTFAGVVAMDSSSLVSQVKDNYSETIDLLSGKEES